MNDLEQRLKNLKPKVNRKIFLPSAVSRQPSVKNLLACACSFLLGLMVMYGVMRQASPESPAPVSPPVVEKEEKPSRFTDEAVAVRPKEAPSPAPKVLAGESYTYLSLLRKYQKASDK